MDALSTYNARLTFAWTLIFLILALGAVFGRLCSRYLKRTTFGLDDLLIVGALVAFTAQCVVVFLAIFIGGVGHPLSDFQSPEAKLINLLKLVTAVQYPYGVTMGLIRCSICVLILRLFRVVAGRTFRLIVYGAILFAIAQALYVILEASLICRPFAANWDKALLQTQPGARCGDSTASYIAVCAWGIACDLYIFFLPLQQVTKLVMTQRHRILLYCVFGLGIVDVIVAVFRIVAVKQAGLDDPNTVTLSVGQGMIWGLAEGCIAIMVACGPLLRPVLDKLTFGPFRSWASSLVSSSSRPISQKTPSGHHGQDSYKQMDDQIELVPEGRSELGSAAGSSRC